MASISRIAMLDRTCYQYSKSVAAQPAIYAKSGVVPMTFHYFCGLPRLSVASLCGVQSEWIKVALSDNIYSTEGTALLVPRPTLSGLAKAHQLTALAGEPWRVRIKWGGARVRKREALEVARRTFWLVVSHRATNINISLNHGVCYWLVIYIWRAKPTNRITTPFGSIHNPAAVGLNHLAIPNPPNNTKSHPPLTSVFAKHHLPASLRPLLMNHPIQLSHLEQSGWNPLPNPSISTSFPSFCFATSLTHTSPREAKNDASAETTTASFMEKASSAMSISRQNPPSSVRNRLDASSAR